MHVLSSQWLIRWKLNQFDPMSSCIHMKCDMLTCLSLVRATYLPACRYKQLWHSLGYNRILAARPPMTSIMFPIQGQLLAANFTHKLLQKARAHPKAPILVHLFSGGGFIFMGWVFQLLAELKSPEAEAVRSRIAGVVLDSSPAMVTADVSSRALVAAALGRPAEGIEAELPWLIKPAAAIVDGYLRLPYVKDALVGMDTAWMQQAPACPKLFLYSDADVLVQPQVVEGFMQQQEKRGSRTYSYKWKDSAHVDHYRRYPQEYKQQLQQFVQRALSSWALTHQGKQQDV